MNTRVLEALYLFLPFTVFSFGNAKWGHHIVHSIQFHNALKTIRFKDASVTIMSRYGQAFGMPENVAAWPDNAYFALLAVVLAHDAGRGNLVYVIEHQQTVLTLTVSINIWPSMRSPTLAHEPPP